MRRPSPYPLSAVRTIALAAQGLTDPLGTTPEPNQDAIFAVLKRLGCLQIDTLQRVHRSHYMTVWSRLGAYDPMALDHLAYTHGERRLFEYWFHGICLLPLEQYRYRLAMMRRHREEGGWNRDWLKRKKNRELVTAVYQRVKDEGPLRSADFKQDAPRRGSWWDWKPAKQALEVLFNQGDLMIADRVNFQRLYELRERVLPDWVDQTEPTREQTARHVLERAAKALGACKPNQIADYSYDLKRGQATPYLQALIAEGALREIQANLSDGKVHTLLVHRDNLPLLEQAAQGELVASRTTFLNPFDPLFFPRGRDILFWSFEQVLEAYKPAQDRRWGYYCMPILHGDRLVGRFDPKLDRSTGRLSLEALYLERGISADEEFLHGLAMAMRDFMAFHAAQDLIIEKCQPESFARILLNAIA